MKRQCEALNKGGLPCGAPPMLDRPLCYQHDPEFAEEAAEARREGGKRRRREAIFTTAYDLEPLDNVAGIRRLLDAIVADTLALDGGVPRLRTLISVTGQAIKLLQVGELEERISRLEARNRKAMGRKPDDLLNPSILDVDDDGEESGQ